MIYVSLALDGTLANSPAGDVIVSELPTLIFISICLVVAMRWAEIHLYAMRNADQIPLRKVYFLLLLFILLIFLAYNPGECGALPLLHRHCGPFLPRSFYPIGRLHDHYINSSCRNYCIRVQSSPRIDFTCCCYGCSLLWLGDYS